MLFRSGSYGKLMKAYYAKQDADKLSQTGDSSKTLTLMRSSADSLKKSAEALGNASLYEKKKFKKKDEETGEETEVEDYDWVMLEIIPKGKVPKHFKKSKVPCRFPYIFNVPGPDTFLAGSHPLFRRNLLPGKIWLQRRHPCID